MMLRFQFALMAVAGLALAPSIASAEPAPAKPDTIMLAVDATNTIRSIFTIHETLPASASDTMVMLYPQWEVASHAPTVPVQALAGLMVAVDGHRVEWRRDPKNVYAFRIAMPPGAKTVELDFQVLSDADALREEQANIQWQRLLLYPSGRAVSTIAVAASLTLPVGMQAFGSLQRSAGLSRPIRFSSTSLNRLVDAPVWAARVVRRLPVADNMGRPVTLDLLADDPAYLAHADVTAGLLRNLVAQTSKVFGPAPFRHYDILVSLSDRLGAGGVEHLEEGENNLPSNYLDQPGTQLNNLDLIAHEYVHAWNGLYRLPADLATPTYNEPVSDSLLWVYEGQTEFWGRVLAARAGLRDRQQTLDKLALDAAVVETRAGRIWKNLADSANDPVYMAGRHVDWRDWTRREDYYPEGVLLWLDVDARLRELTHGAHGLDTFAAGFFRAGIPSGPARPYDFTEVCAALAAIAPYDWQGFLRRHLEGHDTADAMAGLARSGWRLSFTPAMTETFRQNETDDGASDYSYSIGAKIDDRGRVRAVLWDSPAFRAGIVPGASIASIDDKPYTADALRQAVAATVTKPLVVTIADGTKRRQVRLAYQGGARYPHLEAVSGARDWLTTLIAAR